jgi:proteic killer suppression protein
MKQIDKLPSFIGDKLLGWTMEVERIGLEEVRKIPGYHDEPLKGKLAGLRSIRLSKSYRAYYRITKDRIEFVTVEGVDKHEY